MPYFVAIAQHPLIGDCLTEEGVQALWPITTNWYGVGISAISPTNISLEWIAFLVSVALMFETKDVWTILKPHPTNLLLSIPAATTLLPTLTSFPLAVPTELVIPHLTYTAIFALSALIDLRSDLKAT